MKNLVLLLVVFLLFSCGSRDKSAEKVRISQDSIISKDLLVLLLADIHLVDAALLLNRNKGIKPDHDINFYYNGVFQKYRISKRRFEQNLDYWKQNPEEFGKVYEEVIAYLSKRRSLGSDQY